MENSDIQPGSLLDPEQVMMLIEAGASDSPDLFKEILALFEEESRAKLAELVACRESGEYDALGKTAHALAGSSANIGAREVWLKAKHMENLCREGKGAEASTLISDLSDCFDESLLQLKQFVASMDSPES